MIKKLLAVFALSAALGGPVAAETAFPAYKALVDAGVHFPAANKARRTNGAFVAPENVLRVVPGLTKTQVYTLLDVPHFGKGLFGERTWNYILNFYTGEGDSYISCQYQIHYNRSARVENAYWQNQACADFVARAAAPKIVQVPVVERQIVQAAPVPAGHEDFFFDHNRSDIAAGDFERINQIAQKLASGQYRTATVVGMTDTTGGRAYNDALAIRRAEAIASAIRMAGAGPNVAVSTSGSRELAVATPPGVREQANRKVVVLLTK